MSGRGRGGWRGRGGRGFSGGGRGPPSTLTADPEDGSRARPPQLFPDMELPDIPDAQDDQVKQALWYRELVHFYRTSPYYLEKPVAQKDALAADLDQYANRAFKRAPSNKAALSKIMTLDPKYFPAELFNERDQRVSEQAAKSGGTLSQPSPYTGRDIFSRMEQLAAGEVAGDGAEEGDEGGEGDARKSWEERVNRRSQLEQEEVDADGDEEEEEEDNALHTEDYDYGGDFQDDEEYDFEEDNDDGGACYT